MATYIYTNENKRLEYEIEPEKPQTLFKNLSCASGSALDGKAPVIIGSASGAVATFSDGADNMPVESLKCYIEPVQSGSGTPSPTNVRAISGWTGVNVTAAGKNLWNGAWVTTALNNEYSGQWQSNYIPGNIAFPVIPGTSYAFSVNGTATMIRYRWLDSGRNSLGNLNNAYTVTAPENASYLQWRWYGDGSTESGNLSGSAQLELGTTATAYEPYTAHTLSVTFPTSAGRVYGGYVDVVKGELVVDRVFIDLATTTYKLELAPTNTASIKRLRIGSPSDFKPASSNSTPPETLISNKYATIGAGTAGTYGGNTGVSVDVDGTLYVCDSSIQTVDAWRASGTTIVTPIGTPEEYTLTPQELNTLLGNNSIYCDTGNTEVSYPADTKLYIDGKIAELQALVLEN